jgi:hypothetical protein
VIDAFNDDLRKLALFYLNDPNSQHTIVRMGPGHANEVTVDITSEVAIGRAGTCTLLSSKLIFRRR